MTAYSRGARGTVCRCRLLRSILLVSEAVNCLPQWGGDCLLARSSRRPLPAAGRGAGSTLGLAWCLALQGDTPIPSGVLLGRCHGLAALDRLANGSGHSALGLCTGASYALSILHHNLDCCSAAGGRTLILFRVRPVSSSRGRHGRGHFVSCADPPLVDRVPDRGGDTTPGEGSLHPRLCLCL